MPEHLIAKLEQFAKLSAADKEALAQLASQRIRTLGAREDVMREGEKPRLVHVILSGWACRYKVLEDGRRQITAFLVPGDIGDLRMFILRELDHSLGVLTGARVAEIPGSALLELTDRHPRIARALWWNSLVEEAIAREWTTNLGQRSAHERMAHLLCELFLRLRGVGLTEDGACELPVTQADLADALGMSAVHVNRTLQEMRESGLVVWKGKRLTIPDLNALRATALFNPNYLHLDREGRNLDANGG